MQWERRGGEMCRGRVLGCCSSAAAAPSCWAGRQGRQGRQGWQGRRANLDRASPRTFGHAPWRAHKQDTKKSDVVFSSLFSCCLVVRDQLHVKH